MEVKKANATMEHNRKAIRCDCCGKIICQVDENGILYAKCRNKVNGHKCEYITEIGKLK